MFNSTNHQGNANQSTRSYHLAPARIAVMKKTTNSMCRWGCEQEGTLVLSLGWPVGATVKNNMESPQKIKTRYAKQPSNSTSGYGTKCRPATCYNNGQAKLMWHELVRRKEVFYSCADHLRGWGAYCPKAPLNASVQAGVFIRKDRERTKKPGVGCVYMQDIIP